MISTMEKDLKVVNGNLVLVWKELPNWYGIEDIGFIWHGEWADPEIEYKGKRLNVHDIEDGMWEKFVEIYQCEDFDKFSEYMKENAEEIYYIIEMQTEA